MTNPFFSAPPRRVLLLPLFVVTGLTLIPITPAHAEKPKVVVLEIKANGLAPEEAKTLGVNLVNIIAAEVDKLGYDVFSSNDIKSMLAMDEQKMLMGCSDVSCLAEIGGALGSELMVNTTLGKMGDSFILSLTLVDTKLATVKGRFNGKAGSAAVLSATVRRGVNILFGKKKDVSGTGTIFLKTTPPGAEVIMDGKPVGTSPLALDEISVGEHLFVAKLGELSGRVTVSLEPDALLKMVLQLEEALPVKLKVFSKPLEAQVFIDGKSMGVTPLVLTEVRPGSHKIRLSYEGYQDDEQVLELSYDAYERSGGTAFKHDVQLKRNLVELIISGLPENATVSLDGKTIEPDGDVFKVVPGARKLEVTAAGHELLQKELTLVPDEAANVDIKMSVLPEYKEQIETRRTKQSLGSIFKTTAIATAVGGAAFLLGAGYYKNKTDDAWALYHDGTDVSEYESLYNDVQDNIDKGQFLQQAAFGLFGVSALSLGFSVYSYMTSPDVPDAQTDLKVEAALVPGGAMMSFTGHF